jgi:hypothetical protein
MGSSGKKKTTMAKLNREHRLREKRYEKEARKAARKLAATNPQSAADETYETYEAPQEDQAQSA